MNVYCNRLVKYWNKRDSWVLASFNNLKRLIGFDVHNISLEMSVRSLSELYLRKKLNKKMLFLIIASQIELTFSQIDFSEPERGLLVTGIASKLYIVRILLKTRKREK